jgi:hypothetical protein
MMSKQDKAALLSALRKPILTQQQLDEILARSSIPASKHPATPRHISLLRGCKEMIGLIADGTAVWPYLGISGIFSGIQELLHLTITLQ